MRRKSVFLILISLVLGMTGCGYSSLSNEVVGQPKRVINVTPILCFNRVDLDLSLSVMRNGTGSVSTSDDDFTVLRAEDIQTLKQAVEGGKLVKVTYNTARFRWCSWEHEVTKVELLQ